MNTPKVMLLEVDTHRDDDQSSVRILSVDSSDPVDPPPYFGS